MLRAGHRDGKAKVNIFFRKIGKNKLNDIALLLEGDCGEKE